jgi:hypothetical protein
MGLAVRRFLGLTSHIYQARSPSYRAFIAGASYGYPPATH